MTQLTYQAKCKDVLEKEVKKVHGGPDGKYLNGIVYLPRDWIGKKVHVILEPEE